VSTINSAELTEIVYFPEMADKPPTLAQRMETVEAALGIPRKTKAEWTRDHLLALSISIGTFILILIAYFAWWQPQWKQQAADEKQHAADDLRNQIDRQIDTKFTKPFDDLRTQVAGISSKLDTFIDLEKTRLDKISKIGTVQFRNQLPEVAEAIKAVSALNISPPPDVLNSMRHNFLATDAGAPGYWLAASSFITYRSKQESGQSFEGQLPRCYDGPPAMRLKVGEQASIWTTPVEWKNCVLNLEDEMPQKWWESLSGSKLYKERVIGADPVHILLLTNCLVRYQGGPISSRVFTVLGFTFFQNCLFEFSFSTAPPKEGGELSKALIASATTNDVRLITLRQ
jgi:hypothetical protein